MSRHWRNLLIGSLLAGWLIALLLGASSTQALVKPMVNDPGGGGCGVEYLYYCARIRGSPSYCATVYQKLGVAKTVVGCFPVNRVGSVCGGTDVWVIAYYYNPYIPWMWYYLAGFGWVSFDWVDIISCWV